MNEKLRNTAIVFLVLSIILYFVAGILPLFLINIGLSLGSIVCFGISVFLFYKGYNSKFTNVEEKNE